MSEPTAHSEFEVQATIWAKLRDLGICARGEVKTVFSGRAQVRFDVAIFEDGQLAGIIEVKKSEKNHKTTWEETRQGSRYGQFGVPVRIVYGMDQAMDLIQDAAAGDLWKPERLAHFG